MSPKPNFKGFDVFLSAVYPSDTEQRPQALAEQVSSQQ